MTLDEVADVLKLSRRTVEKRIFEGKLRAVRIGRSVRVSPAALRAYLNVLGASPEDLEDVS